MKNLNTLNQSFQKAETRTNVERERERERARGYYKYAHICIEVNYFKIRL